MKQLQHNFVTVAISIMQLFTGMAFLYMLCDDLKHF